MKPSDRSLTLAITGIGVAMVLYQLVSIRFLLLDPLLNQNVHLGFALVLVFLHSVRVSKHRVLALSLVLLSLLATGYVFVFYTRLSESWGIPEVRDMVVGVILVVVVLEATRRSWGLALPIVGSIFVLYLLYGHILPYPLNHEPVKFGYAISTLSIGLRGIYGTILNASASYIFLFIIFGCMMETVRLFPLLIEVGKAASRITTGGAGMIAVVSSTLVGMVTGAAVANVAITGSFTIPAMKKAGFRPATAGAVEAAASTGGQLMPPVMGTAAFLMAAILGIPYVTIMIAAIIPAFLYYVAVGAGVRAVAVGLGIPPSNEAVDTRVIWRRSPAFVVPLGVIVVMLLMRLSTGLSAAVGLLSLIVISYGLKETRASPGELADGLGKAAVLGAQVAVACACVGLLAQTVITSGMGSRISDAVEMFSRGNLPVALLITMFVSLLLGLGIPTMAAYAIVGIIAAPVLVRMGAPILAAHFFAFYFAIISALTPPVALAALAGASIAGASYLRTSVESFRLAISGFIIPYVMIYNMSILGDFSDPVKTIVTSLVLGLGLVALTTVLYGYFLIKLKLAERALWSISTVLFLAASFVYDLRLAGLSVLVFAGVTVLQKVRKGALPTVAA